MRLHLIWLSVNTRQRNVDQNPTAYLQNILISRKLNHAGNLTGNLNTKPNVQESNPSVEKIPETSSHDLIEEMCVRFEQTS